MKTLGMIVLSTLILTPALLRPGAALDAETQALERAALCQALPYRPECRGAPRAPRTPSTPPRPRTGTSAPVAQAPSQVETPLPTPAAPATPTRDDFIHAAQLICQAQLGWTAQTRITSKEDLALAYVCMRAYLAREGIVLPR